jgi:LEA14-like dessication related protein
MTRGFNVLALTAALASAGCSKPAPPKITPKTVQVASVTPTGLVLSLELLVENPNPFPLIARKVTGELKLDSGVLLGKGSAEPNGSVPAKGSLVIPSRLDVDFTNVAALAPLALSAKPVPYSFQGIATIGGDKLNVDVPFTVRGELSRAQVLQAGLRGLGAGGLQLP